MEKNLSHLKRGGEFLLYATIAGALIAGCGGGGGSSPPAPAATTSATITPYKGAFSSSTVTLRDANGNPVTIISGGTINASGVIDVTYNANVTYPLIVEVTGSYYNENTGITETSTVPLRSVITSASSAVPVTIVTETAVADLQNRLGTFSSSTPITAASAVAALDTAGTVLGIPASTVPVFDPATNKTGDANTLRLSALAIIANNHAGATLADKAKTLADSLVKLGANAPTTIISQATCDSALATVTSGASSMLAAGATIPTPATISTVGYATTYAANTSTNVAMVWDQPQATWDNVDWQ